jgi:uncharacterized membrane protein (DUF2068 family)
MLTILIAQSRQKLAKLTTARLFGLVQALLARLLHVLNHDDVQVLNTWLAKSTDKSVLHTPIPAQAAPGVCCCSFFLLLNLLSPAVLLGRWME